MDVRQLALSVLADARIINRPAELDEPCQEGSEPSGKSKTACIPPPWCVWPLPASSDRKSSANKDAQQSAPSARFLGAPLTALAAAGIGEGQAGAEAISTDPERMYETMRRIRDCGGFLYGNLWALARFAFNQGVDTSDLQRLFEWTIDDLSVRNYQFLKNYLCGLDRPVVRIHSKREARQLVTSIEEPKSSRSAWNKLAHPIFFTFTKSHEGPITSETVGEIRVFDSVTQNFVSGEDRRAGKAQFCDLEPSRVTVALAVGQVMRMSAVIGDAEQKLFNVDGIKVLKDWLWSLSDRERRLARHLILSPGDRRGYKYLLEYAYAATILGTRVVDDRRYRHKAVKDLQLTATRLLERVQSLALPNVCIHLRTAIASMGIELKAIPLTPAEAQEELPEGHLLGLEEDGDSNLPGSATELPKSVTDTQADLPGSVTDLPKSVTNLPGSVTDLPKSVTNLPGSATNLPKSVTLIHVTTPFSTVCSPPNRNKNNSEIISHQIRSELKADTGAQTSQPNPESFGTDRIGSVQKPQIQNHKAQVKTPSHQQLPLEQTSFQTVEGTLPSGWESLDTWLDLNPNREFPAQLVEALLAVGITPGQFSKIQTQSPLSAEAMWAVHQAIQRDGKGLNKPAGTLYNALLMATNARKWLLHAGPTLRRCGWFAELTDGTRNEPIGRQDQSRTLGTAGYKRMPLTHEKEKEAAALRGKEAQESFESSAQFKAYFDESDDLGHDEEHMIIGPSETRNEDFEEASDLPSESTFGNPEQMSSEVLPESLRSELAALRKEIEGHVSQKSELMRAALTSKNSAAVLSNPDYMACGANIRELLGKAGRSLSNWGGRVRLTTGSWLDFATGTAVPERELQDFLNTLS